MVDASTILATSTGIAGLLVAVGSVLYQRKQTQIMEAGLERAIEVKITKEFDAPEGETGAEIESKLRAVINKRLSDNRALMRKEFGPRLDKIEQTLQGHPVTEYSNNLNSLIRLLADQKEIKDLAEEARRIRDEIETAQQRIFAETGRYSADIAAHGNEIESLQRQLEDVRGAITYLDTVRAQLRLIGQQLLQMAN